MKLKRDFNSIKKNISNKITFFITKIILNIKKRVTPNSINNIKRFKINDHEIRFTI